MAPARAKSCTQGAQEGKMSTRLRGFALMPRAMFFLEPAIPGTNLQHAPGNGAVTMEVLTEYVIS
jgi:hypothetical protein